MLDYWQRDLAKTVIGYQWHNDKKEWSFPITSKDQLLEIFPAHRENIKQWLKDIQVLADRQREVLQKRKALIEDAISKHTFKRKPYEHQINMVIQGLLYKQFAFLCEMGTGKTQAIVEIYNILKTHNDVVKCLIVAPKTICENWIEEFEINSNDVPVFLTGTKKQRFNLLKNNNLCIINYEGLLVLKEEKELWKSFNVVVLDESSKIKNHQAKRTKLILKLFDTIPYKYILSGTPITQSPIDIYPQFKFLNSNYLGFKSFYSFRNTYCNMGGYGGYEVISYKNLGDLNYKISRYSIQLKKEDCVDLPEKVYQKRYIRMSERLETQYKQMNDELLIEFQDETITANIVLTKLLRLQEITSGCFIDNKDNNKIKALEDIIDDTRFQKKIVWCRFRKSIELIGKMLEEKKIKYVELHGDIVNRQEVINDFNSKKDIEVFIGQIQTGGMGINLIASSITIYYDNTFSLEDRLQSEARNHRIGQENKVAYIDLIYQKTIDEVIWKAIIKKQDVSKKLIRCYKGIK